MKNAYFIYINGGVRKIICQEGVVFMKLCFDYYSFLDISDEFERKLTDQFF